MPNLYHVLAEILPWKLAPPSLSDSFILIFACPKYSLDTSALVDEVESSG